MINVERSDKRITRFIFDIGSVEFNVELRGHITVLDGFTASGKTFFLKQIYENYPNNKDAFRKCGLFGIIFVNAVMAASNDDFNVELLGKLKRAKNHLILIDNGDKVLNGCVRLLKYIAVDTDNQYIICSRGALGLDVPLNHYGKLTQIDRKIITTYH
jgi:hypothetical protein